MRRRRATNNDSDGAFSAKFHPHCHQTWFKSCLFEEDHAKRRQWVSSCLQRWRSACKSCKQSCKRTMLLPSTSLLTGLSIFCHAIKFGNEHYCDAPFRFWHIQGGSQPARLPRDHQESYGFGDNSGIQSRLSENSRSICLSCDEHDFPIDSFSDNILSFSLTFRQNLRAGATTTIQTCLPLMSDLCGPTPNCITNPVLPFTWQLIVSPNCLRSVLPSWLGMVFFFSLKLFVYCAWNLW